MTIDTYYLLYHVESKRYLTDHYRLDAIRWQDGQRLTEEDIVRFGSSVAAIGAGILTKHPLRNLTKVRITVDREEIS